MAVFPLTDEFPRGLQFLIDDIFFNTQLLYVEKASGWIDAYYTLFGPLLIVFIMAFSDKINLRGGVIGVSLLFPITYFVFVYALQQTTINEYLFDKKTQIFTIQKVSLDHDKSTEREIIRTIPFNEIASVQYLECPIEYPYTGYELNLILTSGQRINLFATTDATMGMNTTNISKIVNVPTLTPECKLPTN